MEIATKEIEPLIDGAKATVGAACIDRRPQAMAVLDKICEPLRHVPADIAPRLYKDAKIQLSAERIRDAIERGDSIDAALNDCRANVLNVIAYERREGSLKPWSASAAVAPCRRVDALYNGFEVGVFTQMLAAVGGETILEVTLRYVRTDRRTITRDDLRAFADGLRPWDKPDQKAFDSNFTPESVIANAERAAEIAAEKRANPVFKSGPTAWVAAGKVIPVEQR